MPRWSKKPSDKHRVGRGVLRKHTCGEVWYYHHRTEEGRWASVSTGHRDKAGAVEWATAFSLDLTRREQGIVKPEERVSNDFILSAYDEWLKYIESQRKPKTLKAYRSVKNNFARYLETRPRIRRLGQLDVQEVLALREWLLKERSKNTVDNNFIVLRAFMNWCVALKKVRVNPIREARHGVRMFFNESRPQIETYTTAEYAAVITQAPPELARICETLALTGMRISELAMLEWSDVDQQGRWLHVRVKKTHDGFDYSPKDSTTRKIPIHPKLSKILIELRAASASPGYVFPGSCGVNRSDYFERRALKAIKKLKKSTDVPEAKLTLHNFRRYFVSQCADCGIDMACVMAWLGHDDLDMVLHYYRLRDASAQIAMAKYSTGAFQSKDEPESTTKRTKTALRPEERTPAEVNS